MDKDSIRNATVSGTILLRLLAIARANQEFISARYFVLAATN
jgi:hypothetical protein